MYTHSTAQQTDHQPSYSSSPNAENQESLKALYLQVDLKVNERDSSNPNVEDIDGTLDLFIIPPPFAESMEGANGDPEADREATTAVEARTEDFTEPNQSIVNELFGALNACADLWPDNEDEDDANEIPGMMPALGSIENMPTPLGGTWITAENADQFQNVSIDAQEVLDEDGTTRILGPGAGRRRVREEEEANGDVNVDAQSMNGDLDETKWRRTS
ncbi:MAG: hypothetical protein Q9162_003361 [Coniocarpon cinnabarinum]